MIRFLFSCLGITYITIVLMSWGFFISLGWALWFQEKLIAIMYIGGFVTSQIYNEIIKENK